MKQDKQRLPKHIDYYRGQYRARIIIPPRLRPFVLKGDGTPQGTTLEAFLGADLRAALKKSHAILADFHDRLDRAELQFRAATTSAPTDGLTLHRTTIANAAKLAFKYELDADLIERVPGRRQALPNQDRIYADKLRLVAAGIITGEEAESLIGYAADMLEAASQTPAGKRDDLLKILASVRLDALAISQSRDKGEAYPPDVRTPELLQADEPEPISLRKLVTGYSASRAKVGKGTEAMKRWAPVFDDLIAFLKHDNVLKMTDQDLRNWRDEKLNTLSAATVGKVYLPAVHAVLNWAVEEGKIKENVAERVKQQVPKKQRSREQGFTTAEAIAILKATLAYVPKDTGVKSTTESAGLSAAKKWSSVLCAFSGARIAEITQLRKQDFRKEGDTTVMRLRPDAGGIKAGDYRDVPLHAQIIELGFLDFLDAASDGPLFHTTTDPTKLKGAARTVAGRVSEWLQEIKVIPEGLQPNHAWRHRMKTIANEEGIATRVIDAIQGHASKTAGDNYGDVTLKARKAAIDKLPPYNLTNSDTPD
jgi:integrase